MVCGVWLGGIAQIVERSVCDAARRGAERRAERSGAAVRRVPGAGLSRGQALRVRLRQLAP